MQDEENLWLPSASNAVAGPLIRKDHLDFHVARFILSQVGDQFCDLMRQEEEANNLHMGERESLFSFLAF